MKYTTNYNLYKPDYDDTIDVDFLNKNMDVLDNRLNGLDYVQNVNTSDNGLTFIKRNGDTIPVSLNYLPITGGTVTGDTEFTGKLTNNGKDVGRLFNDTKNTHTSIIDWDKMKEIYGSENISKTYTKDGVSKTINYPNWCTWNTINPSIYGFNNKDIYLVDDFTKYDKLIVILNKNTYIDTYVSVHETALLNWRLNNMNVNNLGLGEWTWNVYGYSDYNASGKKSLKNKLTFYGASAFISEIYGVKYDN
nr:MAG TPA: hypothetical protein [Bacteriophage sp.]